MQLRELGAGGPMVGAIGLGTNPLASFTHRPTMDEAVRLLAGAAELGVTLWDTADAYCLDNTDIGYGEWMCRNARASLPADLRERIIIATKGGTVRPGGGWEQDCSPQHLRDAIDVSLQALQTDCIDFYQIHRPDDKVPFADSVGALAEAKKAGKIRLAGLSNVSAQQIDDAMKIVPVASVQNCYGYNHRGPEQDGVLDKCRELGLALLPFSSFGGVAGAKDLGASGALADVARELEMSPQRVVLAWLLQKYERMIPIPGFTRAASIADCAHAADVVLSPEQIARLDESPV